MKTMTAIKTKLLQDGRNSFDSLQVECSRTVQRTDADLLADPNDGDELFGVVNDPENRRAECRKLQDQLDRQGREAFAAEYAATHIGNYKV